MLLNMSILAESIDEFPVTLGGNPSLELAISGIAPISGENLDDNMLWVLDTTDVNQPLPRHAAIAFPVDTPPETLASRCHKLVENGREILCAASGDVPSLIQALQQIAVRYQAWDERLVSAIISGAPTARVLEVGSEGLANPIALFDSSSALIAHAGALPEGWERSIWGDVIERGFVPMEHYAREERQSVFGKLMATDAPLVARPAKGHGEHELVCKIEVDGSLFAMIAQVDLVSPFSPGQQALAMHLRDRLQAMSSAWATSTRHTDGLGSCLRLILEGATLERSVTRFHLRRRGWREDSPLVLISIPVEEHGGDALLKRLQITFPSEVSILHEGHVVILAHEDSCEAETMEKGLAGMLAGLDAVAAASDPFTNLAQARSAYRQCLLIHDLAEAEDLSGVVTFSSVSRNVLVNALEGRNAANPLVDPRVRVLAEHAAHPEESLATLRTYLLCGCNAARAAKRLFMHRNTLDYRMARIENALGCKLSALPEDEAERMILSCTILLGGSAR
jgi:hypothetical protein